MSIELTSRDTWEDSIRDEVRYSTNKCERLLSDMRAKRLRDPIVDQALLDAVIKEVRSLQARVDVR